MKQLALLLLSFSLWGTDLTKIVSARTIAVVNTGTTDIFCPLNGATLVQAYIRPSSTAQIFTVTNVDGTTIEVPSGGTWTLRSSNPLNTSDLVFKVQTAAGAANLQVIGIREVR